jgi:hypothetical protein
LYPGAEREGRGDAACISDSSGYLRYLYGIRDLRCQRDCAGEGIFRRAQERSAMSANLESGCYNGIDTGLLQGSGLVACRRGTNSYGAVAMTLFENLRRRNALDER